VRPWPGPVEEGRLPARFDGVPANLPRAFAVQQRRQKGDPQAAYYLGMMYRNGMAVARDLKAPPTGCSSPPTARCRPRCTRWPTYLSGEGVKRDELAARRWIEKAADLEYPEAVMAMAIGLRDGSMGFERNEALAETQMRFANRALKQAAVCKRFLLRCRTSICC
jgi:TPR repeat protein